MSASEVMTLVRWRDRDEDARDEDRPSEEIARLFRSPRRARRFVATLRANRGIYDLCAERRRLPIPRFVEISHQPDGSRVTWGSAWIDGIGRVPMVLRVDEARP